MFWKVGIIMGVVALIQCRSVDVDETNVRSYNIPGKDLIDESQIRIVHSEIPPTVLVLNFDDDTNFRNSGNAKLLYELRTAVNEGKPRTKRGAGSMFARTKGSEFRKGFRTMGGWISGLFG